MNENKKLTAGVYIPDENRLLYTLDEWRQRKDPTTADGVVLVMDFYGHLAAIKIAKHDIKRRLDFYNAQATAAALGAGRRPFSVHEGVELYRAKHLHGLNDALRAVGGDAMTECSYWTCDSDTDPDYPRCAFVVGMYNGNVCFNFKTSTNCVRAVSAFPL